jgi:colanic acid biosynthesis glycosyl transferase WcaI
MRIIFINRYFYPDEAATARVVTSLASALAAEGTAVHALAARTLHGDASTVLAARETIADVSVHRLWSTRFGRASRLGRPLDYLTFHLSAFLWLLFHTRRRDICVVCTDPPMMSTTAALALFFTRGTLVNWLMDVYPEVAIDAGLIRPGSLTARLLLALRDASLKAARWNVALTSRMADHMAARGIPISSLAVLAPWSDGEAIRPKPPEQSQLRAEWGLSGKFVVGYSGNLGRSHDFGTMLDAAARLKNRTDIVFLLVGSGYRRAEVEAEIARRGLPNFVLKPLQPRERLADSLAAADVHLVSLIPTMEPYIIPSKFYGIAAAGRPTVFVGDPDGEIARLVKAGTCGRTVSIGDGAGLAALIERLAADPATTAELGRNARVFFERALTEQHGVESWSRLLGTRRAVDPTPHSAAEPAAVPAPR